MSTPIEFKYVHDYTTTATFSDQPCEFCRSKECLDGVYFHTEEAPEVVCIDDLRSGFVRVEVPEDLVNRLEKATRAAYLAWSDEEVARHVRAAEDELSKTPPVAWIQNNLWPIHHADFCRYLGEWGQARLSSEAPDGDGQSYLMSILIDPEEIGDPHGLWESIGDEWTAVFVFECLTCHQRCAVEQSY